MMTDIPHSLHFSCYWNPSIEFDELAPRGMKLWSSVLRDVSGRPSPQRYTLYGKISETGNWGFKPEEIPEINKIIAGQRETHLYLYNTYDIDKHPHIPKSLHVALVKTVLDESAVSLDNIDDSHVPIDFYRSIINKKLKVPFWFKIRDIRQISLNEFKELEGYYPSEGWKDFDEQSKLSPLQVRRKKEKVWFGDDSTKPDKGWFESVLVSAMSSERQPLEPGLFKTPSVIALYSRAVSRADTKIPILILGERGTGKTILARFIRDIYIAKNSTEKIGNNDWPVFACGEFKADAGLAKSLLFGHTAGAFTDAKKPHKGLLQEAHGDCIFLDEIADLPRDTQRLLIKAIEEKKFRPIGATNIVESNFRVIAATNRSLEDLDGILDADFFDRISYSTLSMAPLREYVDEDLRLIWQFELNRAKHDYYFGEEPKRPLSSEEENEIIRKLSKEELPGNFRDVARLAIAVLEVLNLNAKFSAQELIDKVVDRRARNDYNQLPPRVVPPESQREAIVDHASPILKDTSKAIAAAFADGAGLDVLLERGQPIDIKGFLADVKTYLAMECMRLKEERKVTWPQICGEFDSRTLRSYMSNGPKRD